MCHSSDFEGLGMNINHSDTVAELRSGIPTPEEVHKIVFNYWLRDFRDLMRIRMELSKAAEGVRLCPQDNPKLKTAVKQLMDAVQDLEIAQIEVQHAMGNCNG